GATRTLVLNRSPGEDVSEALRDAEVRFSRFFNNTPMAMASLDRRGRIGRSNAAFVRMFDLVREIDRPQLESALQMAEEGVGHIPPIDAIRAKEGERTARFYINPVSQGGDGSEAVIVNALDVTEQRALEQQFAQSQK